MKGKPNVNLTGMDEGWTRRGVLDSEHGDGVDDGRVSDADSKLR
jgi:hypothetical protein